MYNINTVISDFIDAAMNNGIALEDGNANRANKYFRVIEKKIKWLREHDELTNQLFTSSKWLCEISYRMCTTSCTYRYSTKYDIGIREKTRDIRFFCRNDYKRVSEGYYMSLKALPKLMNKHGFN